MAVARSLRPVRAALAVVLLALVAGCGATSAPPAPDTAVEEVRTMLRARGRLLVDKDVEGYLAGAAGDARPLEEAIARGAAGVPLSFLNITFNPVGVADDNASQFRDGELEVVYGYEGLPDDNRFRFGLRYDLDRRDGEWVVTGSRHEPQPGPDALPEPDDGSPGADAGDRFVRRVPLPYWARFPVEATRSDHFLVLHPPGLPEAARLIELAEQAREQLVPRLRFGRPDDVHLVVVGRDRSEYVGILEDEDAASSLALVSLFYIPFAQPEGRHMTVNLSAVLAPDDARQAGHGGELTSVSILQHEMAHLALSRVDSPFTPSWVQEGAAMYLAGEHRLESWTIGSEQGLFDGISIAGLAEDEYLQDGLQYAYVNAAVSYLVEEFGPEAFWDFYTRFQPAVGSVLSAADSTAGFLLDSVYDFELPELDRRARQWMADTVAAQ